MPNPIDPSTLRILHPNGKTVGTGFLVAPNLVVTCAHVVVAADAIDGDIIQVQFSNRTEKINAHVVPEFWLDIAKGDVAILMLESVPDGVIPLRMAPATDCRPGNPFYSFGYATAADVQGIIARGTIDGYLPQHQLLQLQASQANHGISGAPVLDEKRGVVVGMITKGHTELGRNQDTTFATPTETIWQVRPQLRPIISPLPYRNPIVEGINLLPYDYDQRIQNFLTEYLGTDSHPVPFGGRDEALHMLDSWLADTTPYLLLAAPAGRGKSALLVRWLDSLKEREDLALTFVPVSIRFGTNMERVFYAALAARLAFLHGDDVPASPETSTAVYRGLVSDYLSKPLANGRTLLVVLDGLDEAADWQAGADCLPSELPAGVRVVVSARFLAGDADWLRRLNWERNGLASAPSLAPLDHAGVADVLLKMSCPLDELSRKVDIVAELYRLSAGDPLLVGLYVGDLWEKGEAATRLKPEDLTGIQPGYKGYFDRWWDDQKKLWGKEKPWLEKHVRAARNLLAEALGPLFKDDFQSLDPELESDYIADALFVLQRFIIGDNQIQGYAFSHPKLGQYFLDELSKSEQEQVDGRFISWCEQTIQEFIVGKRNANKKEDVPEYVVKYYSVHLARAKQPIDKNLELIKYQQWAQAWFTVEGAYGGYLQDVKRAWEQCKALDRQAIETTGKALYMGKQIRCALIESSLHSLAGNIPSELIPLLVRDGIWTLPQTWIFIRQMPVPRQQAAAISALLPQLDDIRFKEALEVARAISDDEVYADTLCAMSQAMPDENIETLLREAREIRDRVARTHILGVLAQRLPEVRKEALEVAQSIRDEAARARMLNWLAMFFPEEELTQFPEAIQAIRGEELRDRLLSKMTENLPEEEPGQALDIARAIPDEGVRANFLSTLVKRLPEKDLRRVLDAARTMNSEWSRAELLSKLVPHLPVGELRQVMEDARAISDEGSRAHVMRELALNLSIGELEQVMEATQAIQNENARAWVWSALAERLPEGELGQVLDVARAIENVRDRASILGVLAQRLPEKAKVVLEMVWAISDEMDRARALSALAQRLPEVTLDALEAWLAICIGRERARVMSTMVQRLPEINLEQVLKAIQDIGNDRDMGVGRIDIRALSELARHLPEVTEEALEVARIIGDESEITILQKVLVHYLSERELISILEMAQAQENEWIRSELLVELVKRLPEDGLEPVLVMARAIKNEETQVRVLCELAQRLPKLRNEVLEKAQAIKSEITRAQLLSQLAQELPEVELLRIFEMTRVMQFDWARAKVLSALAMYLPMATKEILKATQGISDERERAGVLGKLAQCLPVEELGQILEAARVINDEWERVRVLTELMQRFPKGKIGQVIEAVRAITIVEYRAQVLSLSVQRLPEMVGEALETVRLIVSEENRFEFLKELAQHLPDVRGEALKVARSIDGWWRASALSEMMEYFPELKDEALEAACAIESEEYRAEVLSKLAQQLPIDELEQVWEAARAMDEKTERAKVISILAQRMLETIPKKSYWQIEESLSKQASRTRPDLLFDLTALIPILLHIGIDGTDREILQALRDVSIWWS